MNKPATLLVRAAHADRPVPMIRQHPRWDPKTKRDRTMMYRHPQLPDGSNNTSELLEYEVPNVGIYRRSINRKDLEEVSKASALKAAKKNPVRIGDKP